MCWGKTVQIERFREGQTPFSAQVPFQPCPRALPLAFFVAFSIFQAVGSFWASSSLFSSFFEASLGRTPTLHGRDLHQGQKNNVLIILFDC